MPSLDCLDNNHNACDGCDCDNCYCSITLPVEDAHGYTSIYTGVAVGCGLIVFVVVVGVIA